MSVSILEPEAFSFRRAISPDRSAFPQSRLDGAGRGTSCTSAGAVTDRPSGPMIQKVSRQFRVTYRLPEPFRSPMRFPYADSGSTLHLWQQYPTTLARTRAPVNLRVNHSSLGDEIGSISGYTV